MKKIGLLTTLSIAGTIAISCAGTESGTQISAPPTDVVGEVGGEYISYSELKEQYVSGSMDKTYSLEELQEFLPIYLDYKGKMLQAKDAGYYKLDQVQSEFELYAKQAAYAYWMDQEIRPTKLQEFKERYDFELKSSHVLIALQPVPSAQDTATAYARIIEARNKFLNGTPIDELDAEYSTKRNGRSMGGELPWFSVGTTVPEFEDALYNLEIGEISKPVRTQFGYHIILLEDKRERVPSRQVSHIFVRRNTSTDKIDSAYANLTRGGDWADAVRSYSDDRPSVPNEGMIGWVNYGSRYDAAFIDTLMNLDPTLPFSEIKETAYGYHIFKIDSVRTFDSAEQKEKFILDLLKNSDSFKENNTFVIEYLQDKFGSTQYSEALNSFVDYVENQDSVTFEAIVVPDSLTKKPFYRFHQTTYSIGDYLNWLKATKANSINKGYINNWNLRFQQAKVDERLTDLTLEYFPEFENQTSSYKNGLVVYQINEDSVWSAATIDSSLLLARYENNLSTYTFTERHHYYLITSTKDSLLDQSKQFITQGNSPDSLISAGFNVGVIEDSTGAFQGAPFDKLKSMETGTFSEQFEYNNRGAFFYLVANLPARTMTFDEAFNRVVSDYQPIREKKWLDGIRATYNTRSYPEKLEVLYQRDQNNWE
jgi:peptidyl-prolyl cis-trans isomerase SurA